MLGNIGQQEHQDRLLKSLQHKVSMNDMPQPNLKVEPRGPKITSVYRSGRGSLEDHMKLMKYYVCQCGHTISNISHSTISSSSNGTALDTYTTNCGNCGDKEEISFMSMRKTLQEATGISSTSNPDSFDRKNKRLFPYI